MYCLDPSKKIYELYESSQCSILNIQMKMSKLNLWALEMVSNILMDEAHKEKITGNVLI